jgi:serine/threonine-protein kinase
LQSQETKRANDWSPDGRYIVYDLQTEAAPRELWALPMFGDRKPIPIVRGKFLVTGARFSPDGRWLAYTSNETGTQEVYLQRFPGSGPQTRISADGGSNPAWCCGGRELIYLAPDNRLMSVSLSPKAEDAAAGAAVPLFTVPPQSQFAVAPDGQRLLVNIVTEEPSPITVIVNWKPPAR